MPMLPSRSLARLFEKNAGDRKLLHFLPQNQEYIQIMNNHSRFNQITPLYPCNRFEITGNMGINMNYSEEKLWVLVVDKSVESVNNFS